MNKMKWIKPTVLSLLLAFSVFVIVNSVEEVSAATVYVGGGGSPNFPTISAAVSAASSGDIILVNPVGTYNDNVLVNKALTIMGSGGIANIVPTSQNPVFTITVPSVTIKNFNINGQGTPLVHGIYSTAVAGEENQGVLIEDCQIYDCVNGVKIGNPTTFPDYHTVKDCLIYDNSIDGILIYSQSGYHSIELCDIYDNTNHGIEIHGDLNTVDGCEIYNNVDGVHIDGDTNTITGDSAGSDDTYIYLNSDDGIDIDGDYNSIIDDCFIHNNTDEGIYMYDSYDPLIDECYIVYNGDNGVYLEYCDDADISWSYFSQNNDCGVKMKECDDPYVLNCDFSAGDIGIHFITCQGNNPGYDTDGCNFYGLNIAVKVEGSSNIHVYSGKMYGCTYGIYAIYDSSSNPSSGGKLDSYSITGYPTMYVSGSGTKFTETLSGTSGTTYTFTEVNSGDWVDN